MKKEKSINKQQEARETDDKISIRKDYTELAGQAVQKIGFQLKELREISELSQKDAAFYIGLDRSVISKIEHGKYLTLSVKDLIILCQLYGYEPGQLLDQLNLE